MVRGKAQIRVADEDRAVQAGSIVMWRRMWTLRGRFHSIEEERRIELVEMLTVIAFFAPAEYSLGS